MTWPCFFESCHEGFSRRKFTYLAMCSPIINKDYTQFFDCNSRRTICCCSLKESEPCIVPPINIGIANFSVLLCFLVRFCSRSIPLTSISEGISGYFIRPSLREFCSSKQHDNTDK